MAQKVPYYVRALKQVEKEKDDNPENFAAVPRIILAGIDTREILVKLALGLLNVWQEQGIETVPFIVGPEYEGLDALRLASNNKAYSLDSYLSSDDVLAYLLTHYTETKDLALIISTEDYYDTHSPYTSAWSSEQEVPEGSAADLAIKTDTPVILVLNFDDFSFTNLSYISGILNFRNDEHVAGLILTGVEEKKAELAKMMVENEFGLPVISVLPDEARSDRGPSLYTGVPELSQDTWEKNLDAATKTVLNYIDSQMILRLSRKATDLGQDFPESLFKAQKLIGFSTKNFRVAVARDEAFNYYYQENLDLLSELGADIYFFSPLHDPSLPSNIDGLYLGSGNLLDYISTASKNITILRQIKNLAKQGIPILAEGTGAAYLAKSFESESGNTWPLVGVLPTKVKQRTEDVHRYYAKLNARRKDLLSEHNQEIRCLLSNEFIFTPSGASYRAFIRGQGHHMAVFSNNIVFASQMNLYFYANPKALAHFVLSCKNERDMHKY